MQFLDFYDDGMSVFAWEIVVAAGLHERHSSRAYKPTRIFCVAAKLRAGHAPPLPRDDFYCPVGRGDPTPPRSFANTTIYPENARHSARFYALRAASGADGSRPIPTLQPGKGLFLQAKLPPEGEAGWALPQHSKNPLSALRRRGDLLISKTGTAAPAARPDLPDTPRRSAGWLSARPAPPTAFP